MKAYEAVAEALVAEGCDTIFGLMGDGNMSLWGALGREGKVAIISARNEAGAVAMADGYARTTGNVGIATVTCGPGLTQVGTSLMVAVRNRSPLVLIIGEIPPGSKNNLQTMDQRRFVEACGARFQEVTSLDNLADDVAEGFYAARVHRCPVVLNLPIDLQERSLEWDFEYKPSTTHLPPAVGAPSEGALTPLFEKLLAAERPVIVAGSGARAAGAKDEILKLADRIGALLATSLNAKGLFAGQEYDVGISGTFATAPAEHLMVDADFVLGIGAQLNYYTAEGGLMFPSADVARIDINPAPEEIGFLPGLYVHGDARETAAALNRMLEARQVRKHGFRTAETRAVLHSPPHVFDKPTDGLDPRLLATNLGTALPKGSLVTCGLGHFFSFPAIYLSLPEGAEIQFSSQFGAVGQGLPLAIGIGVGNPGRPHVAIEGDGSLMMNIQELETVARHNVQLVLVVWNDAGYGAEAHKLRAKGFEPRLAQWESPDFAAIGRAFGGDGVRLRSEAELIPAVEKGLKAGGLFVIDARVSPSTMSDPYAKIHFGVVNRAPLLRPLSRGA
jgi:thiamine pyrophosphate-dependent acetolactate synthase large subunit-like protein